MTLFEWFRSLLARWFGARARQVLRRGRLTIHRAAEARRGKADLEERRLREIADASMAGAVRTLERLDAALPAGVSAAGTLAGDRTVTLRVARSALPALDPARAAREPPTLWLRRGIAESGEGSD